MSLPDAGAGAAAKPFAFLAVGGPHSHLPPPRSASGEKGDKGRNRVCEVCKK